MSFHFWSHMLTRVSGKMFWLFENFFKTNILFKVVLILSFGGRKFEKNPASWRQKLSVHPQCQRMIQLLSENRKGKMVWMRLHELQRGRKFIAWRWSASHSCVSYRISTLKHLHHHIKKKKLWRTLCDVVQTSESWDL